MLNALPEAKVPKPSCYSFDAIRGRLCEPSGAMWIPYNRDYDPGPPPPPRPPKPETSAVTNQYPSHAPAPTPTPAPRKRHAQNPAAFVPRTLPSPFPGPGDTAASRSRSTLPPSQVPRPAASNQANSGAQPANRSQRYTRARRRRQRPEEA